MRGDRPRVYGKNYNWEMFTPHARGSTFQSGRARPGCVVYPACAGIDPERTSPAKACMRLPRMRGDRPEDGSLSRDGMEFTPHARGSTEAVIAEAKGIVVYPACAGIDPFTRGMVGSRPRLPRMRGDRPVE